MADDLTPYYQERLLQMLLEFLRIWYRPDEMQKLRTAGFSRSTQASGSPSVQIREDPWLI